MKIRKMCQWADSGCRVHPDRKENSKSTYAWANNVCKGDTKAAIITVVVIRRFGWITTEVSICNHFGFCPATVCPSYTIITMDRNLLPATPSPSAIVIQYVKEYVSIATRASGCDQFRYLPASLIGYIYRIQSIVWVAISYQQRSSAGFGTQCRGLLESLSVAERRSRYRTCAQPQSCVLFEKLIDCRSVGPPTGSKNDPWFMSASWMIEGEYDECSAIIGIETWAVKGVYDLPFSPE